MNALRTTLPLVLLALTAAHAGAQDLPPGPALERRIERHRADRAALDQAYAVPLSEARLARLERFLEESRAGLEAAGRAGFDELDRDAQVDFLLLANHLRAEAEELRRARERRDEVLALLPFAPRVAGLEEARRKLEPLDPRDAAARLDAAREELRSIRRRAEESRKEPTAEGSRVLHLTPATALRAAHELHELRETLGRWFRDREGFEPEFAWWCRKPHDALRSAMESYEKWLREEAAGQKGDDPPLVGEPVGRDTLVALLERELVPYTPEEVLRIAERELAWCEERAREAATQLGVDDWKAALELVKGLTVEPGRQDELVAEQAREAIEFVTRNELVTVPPLCAEAWRVDMIGTEQQRTLPFAVYWGQRVGVAYATDAMDHADKLQSMRGNNVHFTRTVTPHELIPGHHLQLFVAERWRTHRELFRTPFLVEGWAMHWEMLLWDREWPRGPEDRVGMLFWRMHRAARILLSVEFHLGRREPEAMVAFLVDRIGHERENARAEVRRWIGGGYGPLYQAAYMLGGLQLRALHAELVGSGAMPDREFHDAVLRQNSIPVALIRAALGDEPLDPREPPRWRFAGDVE